jgi:hypothetical protein
MLNLKNTLDGYLKNVEVIGNTIQDTNNLASIRSVGDKVEGQELYKIELACYGDNILRPDFELGLWNVSNGTAQADSTAIRTKDFLRIRNQAHLVKRFDGKLGCQVILFDENFKYLGQQSYAGGNYVRYDNILPNAKYMKINFLNTTDLNLHCVLFDRVPSNINGVEFVEFQESELEILSPVQLEKVGNVADRIICKDGVWGVEKNVITYHLKDFTQSNYNGFACRTILPILGIALNNNTTVPFYTNIDYKHTDINFQWNNRKINSIAVSKATINGQYGYVCDITSENYVFNDMVKLIQDNDIWVKYALLEPQFIPLPHDLQVKLRTFAGQTNIAFLTEIPGQIKAQVPKSLGATVNTHTEQIADLHNSLERVKKLEETTVSTVETESSFITVDATSNGYFEDVKLEGNTLVNLIPNPLSNSHFAVLYGNVSDNVIRFTANGTSRNMAMKIDSLNLKPSTKYTMVVKIIENTITSSSKAFNFVSNGIGRGDAYLTMVKQQEPIEVGEVGTRVIPMITRGEGNYSTSLMGFVPTNATSGEIALKILVLEGDHTNNPPEYFEGLMSVGQDVEEVSVASVNGNLFDGNVSLGYLHTNGSVTPHKTWVVSDFIDIQGVSQLRFESTVFNGLQSIGLYNSDKEIVSNIFTPTTFVKVDKSVKYVRVAMCKNPETEPTQFELENPCIEMYVTNKSGKKHQSNKKPLLYYNPTTETWEKPVLREWDTIEKHSDGKYYYHKRSEEVVLNGSENWSINDAYNQVTNQNNIYRFSLEMSNIFKNNTTINVISDRFTSIVNTSWREISEHIESDVHSRVHITISATKLSTQDVAGFKAWLKANPTTVVYQLVQEEVYECTNIDLMTYSGETNYIINSGAISPKSLLKVHNNISNVIKILQEKVSLLENTFITGLKSVLSGDMYSLATILYPEDFEQNDNTEQDIMVIPE